ncbi:MAG: thioredoxin family protein [Candidatus Coprovivens sp.]
MAETETKKNTTKKITSKSTTVKKTTSKSTSKTATKKSTTSKKNTSSAKKTTTKTPAKKTATKKTATKKTEPKKTIKKEEVKEIKETKEVKPIEEKVKEEKQQELEKTIIIDGTDKKNLEEVVNHLEDENIILKNKVIKRSKIKKYSIIVLAITIVVVAIGCAIYFINNIADKKIESSINSNILEKIQQREDSSDKKSDSDNGITTNEYYENIKSISLTEFEDKIRNGEDINVMIFSSTCLACAEYEPIMQPILAENDKLIYKIDILKLSETEREILLDYYHFNLTPSIFTVRDGYIKADLVGKKDSKTFETWVKENL